MKQLILAAVAATFVFASAAQAAEQVPTTEQAANAAVVTTMTTDECKAAIDACKDQACKDALAKEHGCVEVKS